MEHWVVFLIVVVVAATVLIAIKVIQPNTWTISIEGLGIKMLSKMGGKDIPNTESKTEMSKDKQDAEAPRTIEA